MGFPAGLGVERRSASLWAQVGVLYLELALLLREFLLLFDDALLVLSCCRVQQCWCSVPWFPWLLHGCAGSPKDNIGVPILKLVHALELMFLEMQFYRPLILWYPLWLISVEVGGCCRMGAVASLGGY
ncbi:hypothetical protein Nepgr_005340 [Nepenthes gracilis]|uniref:Uncharacterized protein n=1 Tax=Nepenthes gracilis TaxID=150966 RepID=A0AAD3S3E2_NEPGR|nr:hypothetical protein Nepgr_005340 [Nepenthes gracilis]